MLLYLFIVFLLICENYRTPRSTMCKHSSVPMLFAKAFEIQYKSAHELVVHHFLVHVLMTKLLH